MGKSNQEVSYRGTTRQGIPLSLTVYAIHTRLETPHGVIADQYGTTYQRKGVVFFEKTK